MTEKSVAHRPKDWAPGIADEIWKIAICARDMQRDEEALSYLCHVLTNAGSDQEKGLELIRQMSGAQIVTAIQDRISSALKSIGNGLQQKDSN